MEENQNKPKHPALNRNAARASGDGMPSLAVRLAHTYGFAVTADRVSLLEEHAANQSYIDVSLAKPADKPFSVRLTKKHSIDLPPGVTIVIGKSGSGKTALTLGRITANNDDVIYVRHGEPLDSYFLRMNPRIVPGMEHASAAELAMTEAALAARLAQFLVFRGGIDIMIVDSLRHLVYGTGGATGKGGVNMTLFSDLSFLDVVATLSGKAVIVVVNPLTDDETAYNQLLEVAYGAVSAVVDVRSPTELRSTTRYGTRRWSSMSLPGLGQTLTPLEDAVDLSAPIKHVNTDLSKLVG